MDPSLELARLGPMELKNNLSTLHKHICCFWILENKTTKSVNHKKDCQMLPSIHQATILEANFIWSFEKINVLSGSFQLVEFGERLTSDLQDKAFSLSSLFALDPRGKQT